MPTKPFVERDIFNQDTKLIDHCLTIDVTDEVRKMFGVPIKEAFVVFTHHLDSLKSKPKALDTIDSISPYGDHFSIDFDSIDIPSMEEVYVVFDDTHTVCFWTSEWGGMKRMPSLEKVSFGG